MRYDPLHKSAFFISIIWHGIILVLIFVVRNNLLFLKSAPEVMETAIRVDVIGLPDKIKADIPMIANENQKKESSDYSLQKLKEINLKNDNSTTDESLPKSEVVKIQKQSEDKRTDIVQKSRLSKQQRVLKQLEVLSRLESLSQKSYLLKGNRVSQGSALRGIEKLEADAYVNQVEAHIKRFWQIPPWLKSGNFRTRVLVKWDSLGNPTLIQIVESSGNDEFDRIVFETIRKAVPFPAPPPEVAWKMRQEGILFGFPQ